MQDEEVAGNSNPMVLSAVSASTSATTHPAAAATPSLSVSNPFRAQLVAHLNIPPHLTDRSEPTLPVAYQRYLAYHEACKTLDQKIAAGTWTGKKPSKVDMVEIFISKSMWWRYYNATFSKVSQFPLLLEWLENGEDAPKDLDVWGYEKSAYSFKDLQAFLDNGGPVVPTKGSKSKLKRESVGQDRKGKRKEVEQEKKGKRKEIKSDSKKRRMM